MPPSSLAPDAAAALAAAASGAGMASLAARLAAGDPADAALAGAAVKLAAGALRDGGPRSPDAPDWAALGRAATDGLAARRTCGAGHAPEAARYTMARACLAAGLAGDAGDAAASLLAGARQWDTMGGEAGLGGLPRTPTGRSGVANTVSIDRATLVVGAALTLASAAARGAAAHLPAAAAAAAALGPWLSLMPDDEAGGHKERLRKAVAVSLARGGPAGAAAVAAAAAASPLDRVGALLADMRAALPPADVPKAAAAVLAGGAPPLACLAALTDGLLPRAGAGTTPDPHSLALLRAACRGEAGPVGLRALAPLAAAAAGAAPAPAALAAAGDALAHAGSKSPAAAAAALRSLGVLRRRLCAGGRADAPLDTRSEAAAALLAAPALLARLDARAQAKHAYGALSCLVAACQLGAGGGRDEGGPFPGEAEWAAALEAGGVAWEAPESAPLPPAAAAFAWPDEGALADDGAGARAPAPVDASRPPSTLKPSELKWLTSALTSAAGRMGAASPAAVPALRAAAAAGRAWAAGDPGAAETAAMRATAVAVATRDGGDAAAAVAAARRLSARAVGGAAAAAAAAGLGFTPTTPTESYNAATGIAAAAASGALDPPAAARAAAALAAAAATPHAAAAASMGCARASATEQLPSPADLASRAASMLDSLAGPGPATDAGCAHALAALLLASAGAGAGELVAARLAATRTPAPAAAAARGGEAAAAEAVAAAERHEAAAAPDAGTAAVEAVIGGDDDGDDDGGELAPVLAHARAAVAAWRRGDPRLSCLPADDRAALASELASLLAMLGLDVVAGAVVRAGEPGGARAPVAPLPAWATAPWPLPGLGDAGESEADLATAAAAAAARGDAAAAADLRAALAGAALRAHRPPAALAAAGDALRLAAAVLAPMMGGGGGGGDGESALPHLPSSGWFAALARYLTCLMLSVTACEACECVDDALAASREGGALARSARVHAFAACFSAARARLKAGKREWAEVDTELVAGRDALRRAPRGAAALAARAALALAAGGAALDRGAPMAASSAAWASADAASEMEAALGGGGGSGVAATAAAHAELLAARAAAASGDVDDGLRRLRALASGSGAPASAAAAAAAALDGGSPPSLDPGAVAAWPRLPPPDPALVAAHDAAPCAATAAALAPRVRAAAGASLHFSALGACLTDGAAAALVREADAHGCASSAAAATALSPATVARAPAALAAWLAALPPGTVAVALSPSPDGTSLSIVRAAAGGGVAAVDVGARAAADAALAALAAVQADSLASLKASANSASASRASREAWWEGRVALDGRVRAALAALATALGPWRALLLGAPVDGDPSVDAISSFVGGPLAAAGPPAPAAAAAAAALGAGAPTLARAELVAGLAGLLVDAGCPDEEAAAESADAVRAAWGVGVAAPTAQTPRRPPAPARTPAPTPRRRAGLMSAMKDERGRPTPRAGGAATAPRAAARSAPPPDLAARVARLTLDGDRAPTTSRRHPVLLCLATSLARLPWEAVPGLAGGAYYRCPSLPLAAATCGRGRAPGRPAAPAEAPASRGTYLINPGGDLAPTQAALEPLLAARPGWTGAAGEPLPPATLAAGLAARGVFFYAGHGGGEPYLPRPPPPARPATRAAAVLMGCSSGALRPAGGAAASGGALAWLSAGAPATVATLWDVTDRDIDRFAARVLGDWFESEGGGENVPPRRCCVARTVARARAACRLPHLIGAAPVVYGVPTVVVGGGGEKKVGEEGVGAAPAAATPARRRPAAARA